jgi:uncharacterized membrane protein
MMEFSTRIWIERPRNEVFDFVSTAENNPEWNSAVKHVERVDECEVELGCRYRMLRDLPGGKVENIYEVADFSPDRQITIRTLSGPTPFVYRYSFSEKDGGTEVKLDGELIPEGLPYKIPSFLSSRLLKRGVKSNLRTLKRIMENVA